MRKTYHFSALFVLAAVSCGSDDVTCFNADGDAVGCDVDGRRAPDLTADSAELADDLAPSADQATVTTNSNGADPADSISIEQLRADNDALIARLQEESRQKYGHLTQSEVAELLADVRASFAEDVLARQQALETASVLPEEREAVRDVLASRHGGSAEVVFRGRTVFSDHTIYEVDDLLAGASEPDAVAKSQLFTDPAANPASLYADKDSQLWIRRPETNRIYYIVIPDNVPSWVFDAYLLATNDIEAAHSDDCLTSNVFVPIRAFDYSQIDEISRSLASEISAEYSTTACGGLARGCSASPLLRNLVVNLNTFQTRMRFGEKISLESDYDSPDDNDTLADITPATARNVVLHELSHILGFDHPRYARLNGTADANSVRVPTTSQGTAYSFTNPTSNPRFTSVLDTEDKQALRKTYSGQCAYDPNFRSMGQACSAANESQCLVHGGACEVDAAGANICRWANHTDSMSCNRYSFGSWQTGTAAVLPGQPGACVAPASSLPACLSGVEQTAPQDYAGRCCTQTSGGPGLFFNAYSSAFATTFFCSDQLHFGLDSQWPRWEFINVAEANDFTPIDAATGQAAPGWQITSSGYYMQSLNRTNNMAISDENVDSGCVQTKVTTSDSWESGIVFRYRDAQNYYVFDVIPGQRRRIRRVSGGVNTTLSNVAISHAANWSAGIGLMVCFDGTKIHTFIDTENALTIASPETFVRTAQWTRIGLWNNFNNDAAHSYLRSFPLADGFYAWQL